MELLTGADAASQLAGKESVDDVDRVFDAFMAGGQVPGYVSDTSSWPTVTVTGGGHTLEYPVIPDYWGVGTNSDPLRAGKTSQFFAQKVADNTDSILPSQKMVRDIQAHASPKLSYIAVQNSSGGADDSTAGMIKSNTKAASALDAAGVSPGDSKLVLGYKKSYVVRPNLNGDYLAIYGGRWNSAGAIVQPPSGHRHTTGQIPGTPNYSDYSHGLILVGRQATLDGTAIDLRDVFLSKDPSVASLVSDEGRFDPVFPNAGSSAGKMAMSVANAGAETIFGGDLTTAAGRAAVAQNAGGTGIGAVIGVAVGLVLRLSPWGTVGSAVAGAVAGRVFGGKLLGT